MNEIGELLDTIDMEYWLDSQGIDYRVTHGSNGLQLNVKECPVCGNSKWKVYINAETGLGNCFAGEHPPGENYSKWSFIKAELGVSNREVVDHLKWVASECGWVPKRTHSAPVQMQAGKLILPESVALPYKGRNLAYLENRRITSEMVEYFNLRFSLNGVFRYTMNGQELAQSYRDRVIIPIFDMDGKLVSFQGRDITGTADQKYLFPPGFASTGKLLYNAHNAIGAKRIVVGEGVFDAIALKMALDTDVTLRTVVPVATFGKHLSHSGGEDQLGKFIALQQRGLKEVTMMWDGSRDALHAAVDAGQLLKSIGLTVNVAVLPKDADPNEVLPEVVVSAFWNAKRLTPANAVKLKVK